MTLAAVDKEVEAAAAAIRQELGNLLSDYAGDAAFQESESESPEDVVAAQIRLYFLNWLRGLWTSGAGADEERMIGVAKAALAAAEKARADVR